MTLAASISIAILVSGCEGIAGTPGTEGATCAFDNQCAQSMFCYRETYPAGDNDYTIDRHGTCQSPFPVNSKCWVESHCYPQYCIPNEIYTAVKVLYLNQTCKTKPNEVMQACIYGNDCQSGYCGLNDDRNAVACTDGQIGDGCDRHAECASGYCSGYDEYTCTNGLAGSECYDSSSCASGTCTNNECE